MESDGLLWVRAAKGITKYRRHAPGLQQGKVRPLVTNPSKPDPGAGFIYFFYPKTGGKEGHKRKFQDANGALK